MYNKILCPIDLSVQSKAALNIAVSYARLFELESIINYTNTINPDIIIMGTNRKDSLRDYMIGTAASYVVENSTYPVLVIPGEK